jgi:hypothetical protein
MDDLPDEQIEAIRKMFPDLDEDQLRESKDIERVGTYIRDWIRQVG